MSQEPDRRLRSATFSLVCAAAVVAIESTSFRRNRRRSRPQHCMLGSMQ
jgi:hypothetical protein